MLRPSSTEAAMKRIESHKVWAAALAALVLAAPMAANAMMVRLDENTVLDLRAPAGTVLIGNPAIADVSLVTPSRVAILGRGFGQTNVVITDRMGRVIFSQEVRVAPPAGARVSIYRGEEVSNYSCSPSCAHLVPTSDEQVIAPSAAASDIPTARPMKVSMGR
jgi:Flp pilus assembly secretin CpaC